MHVTHLFPREPEFFKGAQYFFDETNWTQSWLIRCDINEISDYKLVNPSQHLQVFSHKNDIPAHTDLIIVHYLDHSMANLVTEINGSKPVFIQTWGGDLEILHYTKNLLGPETLRWVYGQSRFPLVYNVIGQNLYDWNRANKHRYWKSSLIRALEKAHSVSFGMGPHEANHIKYKGKISPFCIDYYQQEKTTKASVGKLNKILLGNSSNPTNNHLDALQILKKSRIEIDSITMPMNYGDTRYREWLLPKAKSIFGNRINAITQFLDKDEYFGQIQDCGIVFMHHLRQQALGTIRWGFRSEKQVVLNNDGVPYSFFSANNRIVHSSTNIRDCASRPVMYGEKTQKEISRKLNYYHNSKDTSRAFFESMVK